jgi:hypothetical protein
LRLRQKQLCSGWKRWRLCCEVRCTSKAMGQVHQCWWRICREINVFSRFGNHIFYLLYSFVTHLLLSLLRSLRLDRKNFIPKWVFIRIERMSYHSKLAIDKITILTSNPILIIAKIHTMLLNTYHLFTNNVK